MTRNLLAGALADLYARVPRGMRLGLEPMRAACVAAGHPEAAFEAVHVAGTNGKGSTCAMVESIARAHGMRTGLYTSPHLCRFAERIRIDGEPLDDTALAEILRDALHRAPELSFFETATLAAFLAFREAKVDLAVIEVGIGGRLDATNVIPTPRAAAITRIALDHTDRLGDTLVEIAREKAGIAKPGLDIVLGPMETAVRAAIDEVARANGATTSSVRDEPAAGRIFETLFGMTGGLPGAYQGDNGAVALLVGERIGASEDACLAGLRNARWPGRFERIDTPAGPYLLDAAHNPDGASALARAIASTTMIPQTGWPAPEVMRETPLALVFGALGDKAWREMLDVLSTLTPHRVFVRPGADGAGRTTIDPKDLAARHAGAVAEDAAGACAMARAAVGPTGLVVVCGSIFLVGEVRALLLQLERDPAVAL